MTFVPACRVDGLVPAQDAHERVHRDPDGIVHWLLCNQRRTTGAAERTEQVTARVLRCETVFHGPRKQSAGSPEFRNFFEQVTVTTQAV